MEYPGYLFSGALLLLLLFRLLLRRGALLLLLPLLLSPLLRPSVLLPLLTRRAVPLGARKLSPRDVPVRILVLGGPEPVDIDWLILRIEVLRSLLPAEPPVTVGVDLGELVRRRRIPALLLRRHVENLQIVLDRRSAGHVGSVPGITVGEVGGHDDGRVGSLAQAHQANVQALDDLPPSDRDGRPDAPVAGGVDLLTLHTLPARLVDVRVVMDGDGISLLHFVRAGALGRSLVDVDSDIAVVGVHWGDCGGEHRSERSENDKAFHAGDRRRSINRSRSRELGGAADGHTNAGDADTTAGTSSSGSHRGVLLICERQRTKDIRRHAWYLLPG
mmetsp:Transcript_48941/g.147437  ORF Transcript_48941/g.147437 Transcript_48941/m.147437 type:complete len:331 (+) Transcript_48941:383-1375(+)